MASLVSQPVDVNENLVPLSEVQYGTEQGEEANEDCDMRLLDPRRRGGPK